MIQRCREFLRGLVHGSNTLVSSFPAQSAPQDHLSCGPLRDNLVQGSHDRVVNCLSEFFVLPIGLFLEDAKYTTSYDLLESRLLLFNELGLYVAVLV